MSTVKVSDKPWISCDCDLSDCSTMEISAQLDLLTSGTLSKATKSYIQRNFTEPFVFVLFYSNNVNAYLK